MKTTSDSLPIMFDYRFIACCAITAVGTLLVSPGVMAARGILAEPGLTGPMAKIITVQQQIKPSHQVTDDYWTSTGGPPGADVFALLENSNGYLLAGTLGGGVFRSTDAGETWAASSNGLTATDIRALAGNSAGEIFAATFSGIFGLLITGIHGRNRTTASITLSLSHSRLTPAG